MKNIFLRNCVVLSTILSCVSFTHVAAQDLTVSKPKTLIAQNSLNNVDLWGIYESVSVGENLSSDLWKNSNLRNLNFIFSKIDDKGMIMPLNTLATRALYSGGIAPNDADEALGLRRIKTALRLGNIAENVALYHDLPSDKLSDESAIDYVDNLFFLNKVEEACEIVSGLKPSLPNRKLLEERATCYALHKENGAAALSLEVAASLENKRDEWLLKAANYVATASASPPDFEFNTENGVNYILSFTAGAKLPNKDIPAKQLYLLAQNNNYKAQIKPLALLYNGLTKYNDVRQYFIPSSPETITVAGQAGQISAATSVISSDELNTLLLKARNINEFYNLAKSIKDELKQQRDFTIDNAINFAAAAIINNDKETFSKLMEMDFTGKPVFKFISALLFENDKVVLDDQLQSQFLAEAVISNAAGLNLEIKDYWKAPLAAKSPVSQLQLYAIEEAASRHAIAEVALLSNVAMVNQNPKTIDVLATSRIIAALNKVGLANDAKELAAYVILARNFDFADNATKPKEIIKDKPIIKQPIIQQPSTKTAPSKTAPSKTPPRILSVD